MGKVNARSTKDELVAHAIEQGVPSYEAWATPKNELVKRYAGEEIAADDETEG